MAPRARRDPRSALTICFAAVIKRTVDGPTSNGTCAPRGPVEWRHRNSRSWHSRGTALAAGAASSGTRAAQSNGAPAAPAAGAAKIGGRRGSCGVARGALDGTRVARLDGALSVMVGLQASSGTRAPGAPAATADGAQSSGGRRAAPDRRVERSHTIAGTDGVRAGTSAAFLRHSCPPSGGLQSPPGPRPRYDEELLH